MRSFSELQGIRFRQGEAAYRAALGDTADNDGDALGAAHFAAALKVLNILANPERSKKLAEDCAKAVAEANDARKALQLAHDAHEKRVADHEQRVAEDTAAFEKKCSQREAEIEARDAKSRSDANEAAAHLSHAAQLRSSFEAKLRKIAEAQAI